MNIWRKLRSFFVWQPPVIGSAEGFALRLCLALAIWFFFFSSAPRYEAQPHPNGFASIFDFSFLADPETWSLLKIGLSVSLIAYVAGFAVPLSLGYVLWLMICYGTLRNSQGNIHHGSQAITTVVLAQWVSYLLTTIRQPRSGISIWKNTAAHSRSFFYSQQAVVAGYVCAAIMKIDRGKPAWSLGWHWIEQIPRMAITVTRNGTQHFYSFGEEGIEAMQHGTRVGRWIAENPVLAKILIGPGLYMELLIFFALFNRRLSVWIGLSLMVMHWMIAWIMQLRFPLNEVVILLFIVNVPFLLIAAGKRLRRKELPDVSTSAEPA